jgi:peroxiredoxin Q/BCP
MAELRTLEVNQLAPNFTLPAHDGRTISLADYRGQKNVILFFVRAYSCYSCREHVSYLGRMYPEFQKLNTEVLVIIHADLDIALGYADVTRAPFPVLADATHTIYEEYGLSKVLVFSTRTASVIVDQDGGIRYIKSLTNPWAWRTETEHLLELLRQGDPTARRSA